MLKFVDDTKDVQRRVFLFFFCAFRHSALGAVERGEKKTQKLDVAKATEKSSFALRKQKTKRKQKVPLTSNDMNETKNSRNLTNCHDERILCIRCFLFFSY